MSAAMAKMMLAAFILCSGAVGGLKSYRQPGNRRGAHVIAARQLLERGPFGPALAGLCLLLRGEGRGAAHVLPTGRRPAAALGSADADKIALHISQAT